MALHILLSEEAYNEMLQGEGNQLVLHARASGKIAGIQVRLDSDYRPYYEVRDETGPLPTLVPFALRPYAEAYSWHTHLPPGSPTRVLGRYMFQTAEAIVDHKRDKQGWRTMRIHGPKLEDVYQLYYKLRAGTAELLEGWETPESVLDRVIEEALDLPDELRTADSVRFQCPICAAKYTIKATKVLGKTIRTTCKTCANEIVLTDGVVDVANMHPGIQLVKPPEGGETN